MWRLKRGYPRNSRKIFYMPGYSREFGFPDQMRLEALADSSELIFSYYSNVEDALILEIREVDRDIALSPIASKGQTNIISYKYDQEKHSFSIWNRHTISIQNNQVVLGVRSVKTSRMIVRFMQIYTPSENDEPKIEELAKRKKLEHLNKFSNLEMFLCLDYFSPYQRIALGPYRDKNLPDIIINGGSMTSANLFWLKSHYISGQETIAGTEWVFNKRTDLIKLYSNQKFSKGVLPPVDVNTGDTNLDNEAKTNPALYQPDWNVKLDYKRQGAKLSRPLGFTKYYKFYDTDPKNHRFKNFKTGLLWDPYSNLKAVENNKLDEPRIISRDFEIHEGIKVQLPVWDFLRGSFIQLRQIANLRKLEETTNIPITYSTKARSLGRNFQ
jgi:hypothetical protein